MRVKRISSGDESGIVVSWRSWASLRDTVLSWFFAFLQLGLSILIMRAIYPIVRHAIDVIWSP